MLRFKNFILNEKLLLESRISKLEDKYKGKIDDEIISYFKQEDPTKNKAYFEWMLKVYNKISSDEKKKLEELKIEPYKFFSKLVVNFDKMKPLLDNKDINKYKDIFELYELVLGQLKDYSDDAIKKLGSVDIHTNNEEWLIFTPKDFSVANQYGHNNRGGSNWCVSYGEDFFNEYFCPDGGILMVINKLNSEKDFALQLDDSNDEVILWNYNDEHTIEFYLSDFNRGKNDKFINYLKDEKDYEFVVDYFENNEIKIPTANLDDARNMWRDNADIYEFLDMWNYYKNGYFYFDEYKDNE